MPAMKRLPVASRSKAFAAQLDQMTAESLLQEVANALGETERLQSRLASQKQKAWSRRGELETHVTMEVESNMGRLREERERLQALASEQLRHIEHLQLKDMQVDEQKRTARIRSAQLNKFLQPFGGTAALQGSSMRSDLKELQFEAEELRGSSKRLDARVCDISRRLVEANDRKDQIESEIWSRRHAAAVTESLYRSRLESMWQPQMNQSFMTAFSLSAPGSSSWLEKTASGWFPEESLQELANSDTLGSSSKHIGMA